MLALDSPSLDASAGDRASAFARPQRFTRSATIRVYGSPIPTLLLVLLGAFVALREARGEAWGGFILLAIPLVFLMLRDIFGRSTVDLALDPFGDELVLYRRPFWFRRFRGEMERIPFDRIADVKLEQRIRSVNAKGGKVRKYATVIQLDTGERRTLLGPRFRDGFSRGNAAKRCNQVRKFLGMAPHIETVSPLGRTRGRRVLQSLGKDPGSE